jgi:hypothetical protein
MVKKTCLIPSLLFVEVPVPIKESEQSCSCVLRESIFFLSTIFLLDLDMLWSCSYDN